jgi:hypothetical protein
MERMGVDYRDVRQVLAEVSRLIGTCDADCDTAAEHATLLAAREFLAKLDDQLGDRLDELDGGGFGGA